MFLIWLSLRFEHCDVMWVPRNSCKQITLTFENVNVNILEFVKVSKRKLLRTLEDYKIIPQAHIFQLLSTHAMFSKGACLPIWDAVGSFTWHDRRLSQSFDCLIWIEAFMSIRKENLISASVVFFRNSLVRIKAFPLVRFPNRLFKHKSGGL